MVAQSLASRLCHGARSVRRSRSRRTKDLDIMVSPKARKPPGAALNAINLLLHHAIVGQLFEGVLWAMICMFTGLISPFVLGYKCIRAVLAAIALVSEEETAANLRSSLGIFISGCDSGFGKTAALSLHSLGYTVFAGCLTDEGREALRKAAAGDARLVSVPLDVTKDASVGEAASLVEEWLGGGETSADGCRALLAVVCNAGLAAGGPIDWLEMKDFERNIDVNFYGVIRLTKALLPALKRTAAMRCASGAGGMPPQPRFVINSSIAGKLPVAYLSPYSTSKNACDTYAACLRMELGPFNIAVTTILASFHKTPLIVAPDGTFRGADYVRRSWDRVPLPTKAEYGEAFFECLAKSSDALLTDFAWDALRVNEALVHASTTLGALHPEVYCGCDSRYVMQLAPKLPAFLSEAIIEYYLTWFAKRAGVLPAALEAPAPPSSGGQPKAKAL